MRSKVQAVIDKLREFPNDNVNARTFAAQTCREQGLPVKVAEVGAEAIQFHDFDIHMDFMDTTGEIADYMGWTSGDHIGNLKSKVCQVDIIGFDAKVSDG